MSSRKRVVIDGMAWVPVGTTLARDLERELTVPNPAYQSALDQGRHPGETPETLTYVRTEGGYLVAPRSAALAYGGEYTDETVLGEAHDFKSLITLRPHQVGWVDTVERELRGGFGCVGMAQVGWGKTIASLEVAARLGRKTLILVHKEFLMTQWVERILGTEVAATFLKTGALSDPAMPAMYGIAPVQVGIVQQDRWDWQGRVVVVAMAQTIAGRDLPEGFAEAFGTILVDETHRFAAPTFQKAIGKFPGKYRLGVTATPERRDGLEKVFFAHLGTIKAVGEVERASPRIYQIATPVLLTDEAARKTKARGREDYVKLVSYLVEHPARNRQIVEQLVKAVKSGRRVIVFSGRRAHLETLRGLFIEVCMAEGLQAPSDYYQGGMGAKARKVAEQAQVLFATYSMGKEGLDVPALDACFLATPVADVVQAVGRVLRTLDDKRQPVVVDFVDKVFGIAKGMAAKRRQGYASQGWT